GSDILVCTAYDPFACRFTDISFPVASSEMSPSSSSNAICFGEQFSLIFQRLADLWQIKKDAGGQWQRQAIDFRGPKVGWCAKMKMIRQKRSWTAAEVATALAMVQACGGSVEAASRECGVPVRTLYRWVAAPRARTGDSE